MNVYETIDATLAQMGEESRRISSVGWSIDDVAEDANLPQRLLVCAAMEELQLKKVLTMIRNSDLSAEEVDGLLEKAVQQEKQNLSLRALASHIGSMFYGNGESMLQLYKARGTYIPDTETIPVLVTGTDAVCMNNQVLQPDEWDEDLDVYDLDVTANDVVIIGLQPVAFAPAPGGYMMTWLPQVGTLRTDGMLSGFYIKQGATVTVGDSQVTVG